MKNLIYTVAHGHPLYLEMARECVRSARQKGYAGDFMVLAEDVAVVEGAECRLSPSVPGLLAKAGLIRVLSPEAIGAYDRILYVDADCVFRKHPRALLEAEGVRIAVEKQGAFSAYNSLFMTYEEKVRLKRSAGRRINSGTIGVSGREAFAFLQAWQDFWKVCPRTRICETRPWAWCNPALMDQPALQALLVRAGIEWSPFPEGSVGFPVLDPGGDEVLWHYCGPLNGGKTSPLHNKEIVLAWMKKESEK